MNKLTKQEQERVLEAVQLVDDHSEPFSCLALHYGITLNRDPIMSELRKRYVEFFDKRGSYVWQFEDGTDLGLEPNSAEIRVLLLLTFLELNS